MTSTRDDAIEAEVTRGLAIVAIEMIITLGQHLGKDFDLTAYAGAIGQCSDCSPDVRLARERVADVLLGMAHAMN